MRCYERLSVVLEYLRITYAFHLHELHSFPAPPALADLRRHLDTILTNTVIRVADWSLQHGYHSNPTTPKLQHTSNHEQYDQCGNSSRKLLTMDILMSETCWAHKKWNKIASDIKLVFYSSTITMMHGPINIRIISQIRKHMTGEYSLEYYAARQVLNW